MSDLIRTSVTDGVARLVLDRPSAINALNAEMFDAILATLDGWARDDSVTAIELAGAGERGFSAGADVRELAGFVREDGPWLRFLETEYSIDGLVAHLPKPVTAEMRGITMGGGLGLVAPASRRIVDSTTVMAMPETKIGIFPDAGSMYWLSRGGAVGTHVALTSATFNGGDAIRLGLADESADGDLPTPLHDAAPEWIDECYASDDAVEIAHRLAEHDHPDANLAGRELRARSPFAVLVALRALRRARELDHAAVLNQDLSLMEGVIPVDFTEGVRALLIDKDNTPEWRWSRLEDVPAEAVDAVFAY